jgi:hypothetical protein
MGCLSAARIGAADRVSRKIRTPKMPVMEIPRFRDEIRISDLESFYRFRLSQTTVLWPDQAIPLLGYMCWPNDPAARGELVLQLRNWSGGSQAVPPRLARIQHEWLRSQTFFIRTTTCARGSTSKGAEARVSARQSNWWKPMRRVGAPGPLIFGASGTNTKMLRIW